VTEPTHIALSLEQLDEITHDELEGLLDEPVNESLSERESA
jgi:hypothetical protein